MNYRFLKKIYDPVLSLVLLAIFMPFLIVASVIVYLETKQFPFIKQVRGVSLSKNVISIYKLRTIRSTNIFLTRENLTTDILLKENFREFVPGFCSWLRKSGLDELPQLINVIKGEMSLVGPRPFIFKDLEIIKNEYPGLYKLRESLSVKPGITGLFQVKGEREKGIEEIINYDKLYNDRCSFKLDVLLLIVTVSIVLFASHKDSIVRKNPQSKSVSAKGEALYSTK